MLINDNLFKNLKNSIIDRYVGRTKSQRKRRLRNRRIGK